MQLTSGRRAPVRDAIQTADPARPAKRARASQTASVSLTTWLSSSGTSADPAGLPAPVTSATARVEDRNSVFIGYVYPLTNASSTQISALLDNLTKVVHPTIPVNSLPPQFQNSAPSKRGSTHDMYAYRVMELKPGRDGLGGPGDFGTAQGQENDGENWGGEKVMRVIQDMGASDVLVIVSRWYGGELLGPVRFDHIIRVARAALQHYMDEEALASYREQLRALDADITAARAARQPATDAPSPPAAPGGAYADLTTEKAKRLLLARSKTLATLRRGNALVPSQ
ncbi:hypothetical protein MSPP1_000073 [Malassezia sp. CBS 17886]|nr:hypothetical protein MSPP1_000073 [Malassezia sp. CBS 17886]